MAKKPADTDLNPTEAPDAGVTPVDPEGDDWETKGHLNTLMDAHKIINDPDKMAKVNKLAGRHKDALAHLTEMKPIASGEKPMRSVQDLRAVANKKFGPPKSGG